MKKRGNKRGRKWSIGLIIIIALLGFFFLVSLVILFSPDNLMGNVAYIPIKGVISVEETDSFLSEETASSEEIVKFIEEADADPKIEAMVFDINSPGGSAVASDEISQAIKRTDKITISVIHDVGASGGYWIASATDVIVANKMSIVGSIGVISSYLEFSRLLENYNVTYQRLVSGKYKDMGTPFKELTEEEQNILQGKIDKIHDIFIDEIAANRNLPREKVREIATGEIFLGIEAKELGLVDILGDQKAAEKFLKEEAGLEKIEYVYYQTEPTLWEILTGVMSPFFYQVGIGMGQSLFDTTNSLGIKV